jgi:hypothetical protein
LPLLLSFGAVDVALELLEGVFDDDELAPLDGVDDELDDGLVSDDGGVLGVVGVLDDEDDDIEPLVAGGVVVDDDEDVDGEGVTVGGVVPVVDDSRLQPAIPRTRPVASRVTMTVFIEISNRVDKGLPHADLADSMP